MNWFIKFLTSSIGQKLVMSLTGLFLITFLPVHLAGNLQLLTDDGGESFNLYAKFMTGNPLIKTVSYGLYFFILLHTIQGLLLYFKNKGAKGTKYAVKTKSNNSWASRNMGPLGMIILIFLILHLWQFWYQMHWGGLPTLQYAGEADPVKNLYGPVYEAFKNIWFVVFYVICMIGIGFHLSHGFQSAFQSLGLNHKKYTPLIEFLGKAYSIIVPFGFAMIPLYFYFLK